MEALHSVAKINGEYDTEQVMKELFTLLDEGIDDIENGRLISEEELWAELDMM